MAQSLQNTQDRSNGRLWWIFGTCVIVNTRSNAYVSKWIRLCVRECVNDRIHRCVCCVYSRKSPNVKTYKLLHVHSTRKYTAFCMGTIPIGRPFIATNTKCCALCEKNFKKRQNDRYLAKIMRIFFYWTIFIENKACIFKCECWMTLIKLLQLCTHLFPWSAGCFFGDAAWFVFVASVRKQRMDFCRNAKQIRLFVVQKWLQNLWKSMKIHKKNYHLSAHFPIRCRRWRLFCG